MRKTSAYEGLQENIRKLKTPAIEVWRNQYPDKIYTICLDIPEFTCICPKTGLPDFATIKIEYSPRTYCVELKSFKMYTIFYRNIGIFHEHLVNKMLEDFVRAAKPRWAKITGIFNPRGGITTTVVREYKSPSHPAYRQAGKSPGHPAGSGIPAQLPISAGYKVTR